MNVQHLAIPRRQRGAILIVSLLLLLVMTVLALTASQTTRMQERMAGNARDMDMAFQSAEAGLRAAEAELEVAGRGDPSGRPADCGVEESCDIKQRDTYVVDMAHDKDWWDEKTREYGGAEQQIEEVVGDPLMYTELWGTVNDTLTAGRPGQSGTAFYVHTARANGGTDTATVVLQSVHALRYSQQ